MYPVTITIQNDEQLNAVLAALRPAGKAAAPAATTKTATPPAATAPAASTPPASTALTYNDHIKPLALKVANSKSREVLLEVLGRFGAQKADQVAEAKWPELKAALETALAA